MGASEAEIPRKTGRFRESEVAGGAGGETGIPTSLSPIAGDPHDCRQKHSVVPSVSDDAGPSCRHTNKFVIPAEAVSTNASRPPAGSGGTVDFPLRGLTMGSPLRRRAEGRDNFEFDESRAGNDVGFVPSRFPVGPDVGAGRAPDRRRGAADLGPLPDDEGFVPSRFRRGLTWEPAEHLTGVVELQTLVRFQLRSRGGNAA